MILYYAGSLEQKYQQRWYQRRWPKLWSFLNERKDIDAIPADYEGRILIDSGAHSYNKLNITKVGRRTGRSLPDPEDFMESYIDFIKENAQRRWVFVELDVYGVLPVDYINECAARVRDIPGLFEFVRVYHPVLDQGSHRTIFEWLDQGFDYLGLARDSLSALTEIAQKTRGLVRFHGFAYTDRPSLERFPFYSVDSTTWKAPVIYGGFYDGVQQTYKSRQRGLQEQNPLALAGGRHNELAAVRSLEQLRAEITNLWSARGIKWQ